MQDYVKNISSSGQIVQMWPAARDSIVFPTLAFGLFMPEIVLGQFVAKFVGGFLWSLVLQKFFSKDEAEVQSI